LFLAAYIFGWIRAGLDPRLDLGGSPAAVMDGDRAAAVDAVTGILDTHACEVLALGHTSLPTRDEVGLMSTRRNP
jgi:hypothetical protein